MNLILRFLFNITKFLKNRVRWHIVVGFSIFVFCRFTDVALLLELYVIYTISSVAIIFDLLLRGKAYLKKADSIFNVYIYCTSFILIGMFLSLIMHYRPLANAIICIYSVFFICTLAFLITYIGYSYILHKYPPYFDKVDFDEECIDPKLSVSKDYVDCIIVFLVSMLLIYAIYF